MSFHVIFSRRVCSWRSIYKVQGGSHRCLSFPYPISMSGYKHLFRPSFDTSVSGSACPFLLPTGDDHATVCTRLITIACDNSSPVCDLMCGQLQNHDAHAHRFGLVVNQVLHSYCNFYQLPLSTGKSKANLRGLAIAALLCVMVGVVCRITSSPQSHRKV